MQYSLDGTKPSSPEHWCWFIINNILWNTNYIFWMLVLPGNSELKYDSVVTSNIRTLVPDADI